MSSRIVFRVGDLLEAHGRSGCRRVLAWRAKSRLRSRVLRSVHAERAHAREKDVE